MKKIVVIGSINMDYVVDCPRLPNPGETLSGNKFTTHPGGKGANQATAVAKLGAKPVFIGSRGDDDAGSCLEAILRENKVNPRLKVSEKDTGSAHIFVTEDGESYIITIKGANGSLTVEDIVFKNDLIASADYLMIQLEIPLETVIRATEIAVAAKTKVILDPAPVQMLPEKLLKNLDFILPNEEELKQLTKNMAAETGEADRARELFRQGVNNVIITKGDQGVYLLNSKVERYFEAPKVKAVDTTAAGDAFAGGLAIGLAKDLELTESIKLGILYGSATVTGSGAQSSLMSKNGFLQAMPDAKKYLK